MTCHWIDKDWKLQNVPLGCFLHEGESDNKALLDDFAVKIFNDCGFENLNIVAVVSDTTGNMNKFGELMERLKIAHIYCTDHVLQLTAKKAFYESKNDYEEHEEMMVKVRQLIEHASRSPLFTEKLLAAQRNLPDYADSIPKRVLVDVKTRWWSTFESLNRMLYLRNAFRYMVITNDIDESIIPDQDEWNLIELVCNFLEPFKKVMKMLEGEKYVTISLVPSLVCFLRKSIKEAIRQNNVRLSQRTRTRNYVEWLIKNINSDFEERWGKDNERQFSSTVVRGKMNRQIGIHPVIAVASALDPRYKGLKCYDNVDRESIWWHLLRHAANASESLNIYNENDDDNLNRRMGQNNDGREANEVDDDFTSFMNEMNENSNLSNEDVNNGDGGDNELDVGANDDELDGGEDRENENIHWRMCRKEVDKYRKMPVLQNKTNDVHNCPLQDFWKPNEKKFPVLSFLARMYLAIPATSAPSERLFSYSSRNISKSRNRLDPEIAGMQIFISRIIEWYRRCRSAEQDEDA